MNAPMRQQTRAPDIHLSGQEVEQIIAHLNNSVLFAKSPDGTMRPFVDPIPITQIIAQAMQNAVKQSTEIKND